ncbi:MAG: DUF3634 family protein [Verrucomicrobiota bacterium]
MKLSSLIRRYVAGSEFVIEITNSEIVVSSQSRMPRDFIAAVTEKVNAGELVTGSIYAMKQNNNLTLGFSADFPTRLRQPLLNIWHINKSKYGHS